MGAAPIDWNETLCNSLFMNERMNWDDLQLFLAVARAGGLSVAARETGKSAPTLGRRMIALEAATGSELFVRHARGYQLTEQGEALLKRVRALEADIAPLHQKDRHRLVKVSAGTWMTYWLCAHIEAILCDSPNTTLRFISTEDILDIGHRETVIGLRNHRPEQAGLAGQRLGAVQFAGYARDSAARPWARAIGRTPSALWLAEHGGTAQAEVTAPRNALDLALSGAARALLPTFVGDAQDTLTRVTEPIEELTHDQWLVTHHDDRHIPEVRRVIDRMAFLIRKLHRG